MLPALDYSRYAVLFAEQLAELERREAGEQVNRAERDDRMDEEEERERWNVVQSGALLAAHSLRQPPRRIGSYGASVSAQAKVDLRF
jgi:hypothetical protein